MAAYSIEARFSTYLWVLAIKIISIRGSSLPAAIPRIVWLLIVCSQRHVAFKRVGLLLIKIKLVRRLAFEIVLLFWLVFALGVFEFGGLVGVSIFNVTALAKEVWFLEFAGKRDKGGHAFLLV